MNKLIEYIKIHKISLEQDSDELQDYFNSVENFETDEYRTAEIQDISLNGQIIALNHILNHAAELDKQTPKE